jgi:excisionase family DNA binding protein
MAVSDTAPAATTHPRTQWLSTKQVCEITGLTPSGLYNLRQEGIAPPAAKFGRHLRWPADELDTWMRARLSTAA